MVRSGNLIRHPVLAGSVAHSLFEQADKMLWIFKSEIIGNLTNGFALVEYSFFSHVDYLPLDIFLRRLSSFFFDKIAEIAG